MKSFDLHRKFLKRYKKRKRFVPFVWIRSEESDRKKKEKY